MASSRGRVSRNGSEKMSSSMSLQPSPPVGFGDPLGLDAQQLLLVVPLVQRLGLVEALVALQPDQPGARQFGHRLGQLGLARAGRALDQDRLAQALGQVDHAGDALVGQVADRRSLRGPTAGESKRDGAVSLTDRTSFSGSGARRRQPGSLPGGGRAAPVRSRAQPNCGLSSTAWGHPSPEVPVLTASASWSTAVVGPLGRSRRPVRLRPGSGRIRLSTLWMIFRQLRDPCRVPELP